MPVRKLKYLGGSHVRRLAAGEDFAGRLATPLVEDLTWDLDHNHILEVDLPQEALDLILQEPSADPQAGPNEFADVTESNPVPTSLGQRRWRAIQDPEHPVGDYEVARDPRVQNATTVTATPIDSPFGSSVEHNEGDQVLQ